MTPGPVPSFESTLEKVCVRRWSTRNSISHYRSAALIVAWLRVCQLILLLGPKPGGLPSAPKPETISALRRPMSAREVTPRLFPIADVGEVTHRNAERRDTLTKVESGACTSAAD